MTCDYPINGERCGRDAVTRVFYAQPCFALCNVHGRRKASDDEAEAAAIQAALRRAGELVAAATETR